MLWWGVLADLPTGLEHIECSVTLAQGTPDVIAAGQTPRYQATVPGARFVPLLGAGHAPQTSPTRSCGWFITRRGRRPLPSTKPLSIRCIPPTRHDERATS